jgi:hypothetical protein
MPRRIEARRSDCPFEQGIAALVGLSRCAFTGEAAPGVMRLNRCRRRTDCRGIDVNI